MKLQYSSLTRETWLFRPRYEAVPHSNTSSAFKVNLAQRVSVISCKKHCCGRILWLIGQFYPAGYFTNVLSRAMCYEQPNKKMTDNRPRKSSKTFFVHNSSFLCYGGFNLITFHFQTNFPLIIG